MANPPITATPRRAAPRVQFVETFFAYTIAFDALAPAASAAGSIQVQADSAFRWTKATAQADIAAAAYTSGSVPIPNVTVQIVDSGSGRQLFSAPVPIETTFGSGQLPFILPVPYLFMPRSSISFTVANFDAAVTYNLQLVLHGSKIFNYDANQL